MRFSEVLALILGMLSIEVKSTSDICKESNEGIQISEAFRLNNNLFIMTSKNSVYKLKNFVLKGNQVTFDSIDRDDRVTDMLRDVKWIFNYKTGKNLEVFGIFPKIVQDIPELVGYVFQTDANDLTDKIQNFTINIYKKDKQQSTHGLKTLFLKFPEHDIDQYMTSITNFPENVDGFPKRLFVYYLEKKPKQKKGPDHHFKRYILIQKNITFGDSIEADWSHDKASDACVELTDVVDASVGLTDYIKDNDNYWFALIEFFGNQYSINRIEVSKQNVSKQWTNLKNGSIASLLNCNETSQTVATVAEEIPGTGSSGHISQVTTKLTQTDEEATVAVGVKPVQSNGWIFWLIVIIVIIISLVVIICSFVYFMASKRAKKSEEKALIKSPSKSRSKSKSPSDLYQKSVRSDV